eukprot:776027-Rhodomonas_salina.4
MPISLCPYTCYAISGTDLDPLAAYALATQCPVLSKRMLLPGVDVCCYTVSGTDGAYAAMWCPVLTKRMMLRGVRY